jgi:hypothetical protein
MNDRSLGLQKIRGSVSSLTLSMPQDGPALTVVARLFRGSVTSLTLSMPQDGPALTMVARLGGGDVEGRGCAKEEGWDHMILLF